MAESADILRAPHQKVVLPDLAAGCSMADMAAPDQLEICWRELEQMGVRTDAIENGRAGIIPVTYINSSAAIKAFVGAHGGIVCTSTNAEAIMTWAWERGDKLLMLPDQHLGRNTAWKMGVPLDEMAVWDPNEMWGGLEPAQAHKARLLLWKGHCSVHTRFTPQQIDVFRKALSGRTRRCAPRMHARRGPAADESGSTEYIINAVKNSPAGTTWAVATEVHLVNRLAAEVAPGKTVVTLDPFGCLCSTMFRVSPNHLLWVLEGLVEGTVHNQIIVPDEIKRDAKLALDRMLGWQCSPLGLREGDGLRYPKSRPKGLHYEAALRAAHEHGYHRGSQGDRDAHLSALLLVLALAAPARAQQSFYSHDNYTQYELLEPGSAQFAITYFRDRAPRRFGVRSQPDALRQRWLGYFGVRSADRQAAEVRLSQWRGTVEGRHSGTLRSGGTLHSRAPRESSSRGWRGRVKILKTYKDDKSYYVEGEDVVFKRSLGIARNSMVLPKGYRLSRPTSPRRCSRFRTDG